MRNKKISIYRSKADFFKAFAHPTRLLIIGKLLEAERCVGSIEKVLNLKQANVSQHLNILKKEGIVDYEIKGRKRCYYITEPERMKNIIES
ncbi:MAG: metalloregulator ArsR/SmtB family transcription factor [Elusimicrobia bacterium]|nr:metalloregulator ArsR/SmtB family transcription factor [Elusimicrobiota bacterium]